MMFGRKKRKLNQDAFYLDKDRIEITHEYKYLGIDFYSDDNFEQSSKKRGIASMKASMGTLKKEPVVEITCWKLKSHPFNALVVPTFMCGTKIKGTDFKNSHWKVFEKGMKMQMISHVKVHSSTTYHVLLAKFGGLPIELYAFKLTMGFQQRFAHLTLSWLVSKVASL